MKRMLSSLKQFAADTPLGRIIGDARWLASVREFKSRMPREEARRFDDFLKACSPLAPAGEAEATIAASWRDDGYAVVNDPSMTDVALEVDAQVRERDAAGPIWRADGEYVGDGFRDFPAIGALFAGDAPLARAIRAAFGSNFKFFYCKLYRSRRQADAPTGSQLWHSDGGPGTCMNLMFSLSPLTVENGAMKLLRWTDTMDIYAGERAHLRAHPPSDAGIRDALCAYYEAFIEGSKREAVIQPLGGPGTALMFRNNLIHRGGFPPVVGVERRVFVFHIYPSDRPVPVEHYLQAGLAKPGAYPKDPAFQ